MEHHPRTVRIAAAISAAALALAGAATAVTSTSAAAGAAPKPDRGQLRLADVQPTLDGTVDGDKASMSNLAKTSPGLRAMTGAKRIPVMIKYDYDAIASSQARYRATAPPAPARPVG